MQKQFVVNYSFPLSLPSLFYALLGIAQRGVVILLPTEQRTDGRRRELPIPSGSPPSLAPSFPIELIAQGRQEWA